MCYLYIRYVVPIHLYVFCYMRDKVFYCVCDIKWYRICMSLYSSYVRRRAKKEKSGKVEKKLENMYTRVKISSEKLNGKIMCICV